MRWDSLRSVLLGSLLCLPISLALVAVPFSTTADADVVPSADMLQLNNQLRFAIGAPTVPADPRLTQAAINHANYSSANGQGGHFETAGLPYYTGYSARDRLIAAGWTTSFVSEVATGGAGLAGVRQLWGAPYHRLGVMHPNALNIRWGHSSPDGGEATGGEPVYDFRFRALDFVRPPPPLQAD